MVNLYKKTNLYKKIFPIFCLLSVLSLTSCLSWRDITIRPPEADFQGEYAGRWNGAIEKTIGDDRCDISRLGLNFTVDDLTMAGKIKRADRTYFLSGKIDERGNIINAKIDGFYSKEDIILYGNFYASQAMGTWRSGFCQGTWNAHLIW